MDPREIECSDRTYYLPCFEDISPLAESIRQIGIMSPPVIKQNDSGLLIPVTGRRRLQAAIRADMSSVEVVIADSGQDQKKLLNLLFWDNISRITANPVTVSVIVSRLLEVFDTEEVAERYLPWTGTPPKGPRLERLKVISKLDERCLRALWSGRIFEKTAVSLAMNGLTERLEMLDFIEKYGWNANKSDEILQSVFDLSRLCESSPTQVISDAIGVVEKEHSGADMSVKAEKIRNLIREWKSGDLVRCATSFELWMKNLGLPRSINLKPAQSFENERLTIEITARSRKETEEIIKKLIA